LLKKLWNYTKKRLNADEELNVDSVLRCKIAREAATLLYSGAEKEYKQAKLKAAKILGTHFLPSNLEVALELEKIAEESEGTARKERLVKMRKEALKIMTVLKAYNPTLIGSVWRGTIRPGSDIDIALYHDIPVEVIAVLKKNDFNPCKTEWVTETKKGKPITSLHVYLPTSNSQKVELVVRSLEEAYIRRKCEIFGDELKGINIPELRRLLEENPAKKFVPVSF
jgi:predicted nucleotidyltransferase